MNPDEIRAATARLLMLTASDAAHDQPTTAAIEADLARFDDTTAVTELACRLAATVADRLEDRAAIYIGDTAGLIAFGMVSHAAEHGRPRLEEHLEHLTRAQRTEVAVSLLAFWRQACATAAAHALATVTVPDTIESDHT